MKFVQNIIASQLVLGRFLELSPGEVAAISDEEAGSTEVLSAVRSKWATVSDERPADLKIEIPEVVLAVPDVLGSPTPPGVEVVEKPAVVDAETPEEEAKVDGDEATAEDAPKTSTRRKTTK